jgi:hypothetical protein
MEQTMSHYSDDAAEVNYFLGLPPGFPAHTRFHHLMGIARKLEEKAEDLDLPKSMKRELHKQARMIRDIARMQARMSRDIARIEMQS